MSTQAFYLSNPHWPEHPKGALGTHPTRRSVTLAAMRFQSRHSPYRAFTLQRCFDCSHSRARCAHCGSVAHRRASSVGSARTLLRTHQGRAGFHGAHRQALARLGLSIGRSRLSFPPYGRARRCRLCCARAAQGRRCPPLQLRRRTLARCRASCWRSARCTALLSTWPVPAQMWPSEAWPLRLSSRGTLRYCSTHQCGSACVARALVQLGPTLNAHEAESVPLGLSRFEPMQARQGSARGQPQHDGRSRTLPAHAVCLDASMACGRSRGGRLFSRR
jgi:hypothetical protein